MDVFLFTFDTVSMVLLFENTLKSQGIKTKLMPVPRQFSSSCGTCAIIEKDKLDQVKEICREKKVFYDEVYEYYHDSKF